MRRLALARQCCVLLTMGVDREKSFVDVVKEVYYAASVACHAGLRIGFVCEHSEVRSVAAMYDTSARCMLHDAILVGWRVGVTVRSDRECGTDRVLEERL
jgi:hypothetical protein